MEVADLIVLDVAGGAHQQVLRLLVHGEGDDFADVGLVGEHHDDAVNAGGNTGVGRCAILEGAVERGEFGFDDGLVVPG